MSFQPMIRNGKTRGIYPMNTSLRTARLARHLSRVVLLATLALAAACAGPVRNTGFLDDYANFNAVNEDKIRLRLLTEEDRTLDAYFPVWKEGKKEKPGPSPMEVLAAKGIERDDIRPVLFIVDRPTWLASHRYSAQREDEILFVVRERMYRYLLRHYPHPVRVRYAFVANDPRLQDYRILTIETHVTDAKPGNGLLRYLIGYGAGTSVLQLEGRIYEGDPFDPGDLVAEFAIRDEHAGYPNGFLNPTVMKSHYTLKYAATDAVGKMGALIREHIPPATLKEPAPTPMTAARRAD